MKRISFVIITTIISFTSFSQTTKPATMCGFSCYLITAQAKNDAGCGGSYDYSYTITNNTYEKLDIKMFVEKKNGEWKDLGILTDVESKGVKKDAFWSCDLSGKYLIYYRTAGTNDKFPTVNEIKDRARIY